MISSVCFQYRDSEEHENIEASPRSPTCIKSNVRRVRTYVYRVTYGADIERAEEVKLRDHGSVMNMIKFAVKREERCRIVVSL